MITGLLTVASPFVVVERAAAETVSLWSTSAVPQTRTDPDTRSVEVGTRFRTAVAGSLVGIRFYASADNDGPHQVHLWGDDGGVLAQQAVGQADPGWQTVRFDRPIPLRAGSDYVASYVAPHGGYSDDQNSLSPRSPRVSGPLTALAGVYSYGGDMPSQTWNDSSYYVDVIFDPASASTATTTAPSPEPGAGSMAPTAAPTRSVTSSPSATPTNSAPATGASSSSAPATAPSSTQTTTKPATSPTAPSSPATSAKPTSSASTLPTSTSGSSSDGLRLGCALVPSGCGYPDATNTGVPSGTKLVRIPADVSSGSGWSFHDGYLDITGSRTTLSGYAITGDVSVSADDVTIENSSITVGGESFGVAVRHADDLRLDHVEIKPPSTADRLLVGVKDIYGDSNGTTIVDSEISGVSTGIQIGGGTIEDNYIHGLIANDGDHLNGVTSNGSTQQLTIRHNTILNPVSQTDAIGLFQDFGVEANRSIDDNLLGGGGYTLYAGSGTHGTTSGIKITNNRFTASLFPLGGYWGPATAYDRNGSGNTWSGNVWDLTGLPVGTP
ncbi:hypothetical protein FHX74_000291 [Friedmanniella endophytica]|uniref:DUF4082 domain-containing protein n=1 Tax=Microlunatus kandeliicorticis TaxID=1759536 RepID=A0A7W3IP84_9ACTN|nr:DUF4082 domain-containing protein [Microlunatus kandeliicorticis]MBA8792697.1 hypothetical protein [Microlunatus kandeliicorticis]